jgi:hypothetical protein
MRALLSFCYCFTLLVPLVLGIHITGLQLVSTPPLKGMPALANTNVMSLCELAGPNNRIQVDPGVVL